MNKPESLIQKEIMLALSQAGCMVWRNNTGSYKDGDRFIRYGLCKGSSDIVGLTNGGVFIAVEVKSATGRVSNDQINFIDNVRRKNGISFVARSADEAIKLLQEALNK